MMSKYLPLFSLCLLTCCTVGPDYRKPEYFKDSSLAESLQIKNTNEFRVNKDWYKQFNDVVLNHLVDRGLMESPNIKIAISKLRQARQTLRINSVSYLPTLDIDGSYQKAQNARSLGVPLISDYYQLGMDASWEIDIWGGGRRLSESSMALLRAASADLNNVRLSLIAEIANNYIKLRSAQEQERIAKNNLKIQEDIYSLVKNKYNAGLTDNIALNQSLYIVETTREQIPTLEIEIENYRNALSVLVGKLPGSINALVDETATNLVSRRFDFDLSKLHDLPVSVVRNRPDVQAVEQRLISQNAQIGVAVAKLYPNVNIGGFLGWQSPNLGHLIGSNTDMYTLSPAIKLPLFHFGALNNNVLLQKYLTEEQSRQYHSTLLTAASEIRNAMVAVEKEYQANLSAHTVMNSQQKVADLTIEKYKQGLVEFSEVLTSQQNLLAAQQSFIESNAKIYTNLVSFYKAVGGGQNEHSCQKSSKPKGCCR